MDEVLYLVVSLTCVAVLRFRCWRGLGFRWGWVEYGCDCDLVIVRSAPREVVAVAAVEVEVAGLE